MSREADPLSSAFAPAKVNLTLHVTGRRDDGYHRLDSLVVFADIGDRVAVRLGAVARLRVTGPMAGQVPTDAGNLVLRAARLFGGVSAAITLEKHLPVASGLGGGSSDAAATLRALARLTGRPVPEASRTLALGADLPVCMAARSCRMSGIGETLADVPPLPALPAVLVNPGISLPTPDVFAAFRRRDGAPMPPMPEFADVATCAHWLADRRNDLEVPARDIAPVIGDVLAALGDAGALLARMSGSGATCFGIFADDDAAGRAAAHIRSAVPGWWVQATVLGGNWCRDP